MTKHQKQGKLKRPTVKCHGLFDSNIKVNGGKREVTIKFVADQDTVDLNVLGRMLKDGATAIFVSDQTEVPVDDDQDKPKEAPGQMTLLESSGKQNAISENARLRKRFWYQHEY